MQRGMRLVSSNTHDIFERYQYDWSTYGLDSIKNYTTPRYYAHATLFLSALHQLGRANLMREVNIINTAIIGIEDWGR